MAYNLKYINEVERADFQKIADTDYKKTDALKVEYLNRGIILPVKRTRYNAKIRGGVLNENGQFVELSRDNMSSEIMEGGYAVEEDITYDNRIVLYMGLYKKHWGYFLTFIITRLWYLLELEDISNIYITYTLSGEHGWNDRIEGNFLEFFELLGIPKDHLIMVQEPTRFKQVIVPEHSFLPMEYYTDNFKKLLDYVKDKVELETETPKKIYYTRTGLKKADRSDIGESQFVKIFSKNGYEVVEPSGLTLREQIWLLKNAEQIVAVSGTLMHNLVFVNDEVQIVALDRQGYPMLSHEYQGPINQMRALQITHIDASLRLLPVNGAGPNVFYVSEALRAYLKEQKYLIDEKDVIQDGFKWNLILAWYFFHWLDFYRSDRPLGLRRITGQMDERSVNVYAHYRDEIKWYDEEESRNQRNIFYQFIKTLIK